MTDLDTLRPEVKLAIEWLQRFVVCNPVSSIETWTEYSELASGVVETVRAELLRLAADNCGMHKALCEHDELCEQLTAMRLRAEKSEAELEALKARMKPCAQVVGGEVRALMDPDDEGKYVAVLVVEE